MVMTTCSVGWVPRRVRSLSAFLGLSLGALAAAATFHVKIDGDDTRAGQDWDDALLTIGQAISLAVDGDEIWVAAGRYPEHLTVTRGVTLYGGFIGNETEPEPRDWGAHPTLLDGSGTGIVLTLAGAGPVKTIQGFFIENGAGTGVHCTNSAFIFRNNVVRANLYSGAVAYGGGMLIQNIPENLVAVIEFNDILQNYSMDGGGIACIDASPRIGGNVIGWNLALQNGGGVSCWRNSSPLIVGNKLVANAASLGVEDVLVPVGGGGVFATADDLDGRPHPTAVSAPIILNNIISANGAWKGGGLALVDSNGGVPIVENNTLVANNGAAVYWASSSLPGVAIAPVLRNNLVAFNPWGFEQAPGTPTNAVIEFNCLFQNVLFGQNQDFLGLPNLIGLHGNFAVDPRFTSRRYGDYRLQSGSGCIDAGSAPEQAATESDYGGQARVQGAAIDIGAYESDGSGPMEFLPTLRVSSVGDDGWDGANWATAKRSIQAAIDAATVTGGEIWVQEGTYSEHVVLPAYVYLYGGFGGDESLVSERDPEVHPTVLEGEGVPNIVTVRNAGYRVSGLHGFTLQNGGPYTGGTSLTPYGRGGKGGAIHVAVASPTIANNLITHNGLAQDPMPPPVGYASYGAGIYCDLSYAVIRGNTITQNEILDTFDGSGAGIYLIRSSPRIRKNTFSQNHSKYGSAIYALHSAPEILDNLIEDNAMYDTYPLPLFFGSIQGAVTLIQSTDFLIARNTLRGNTAATGAGAYLEGCLAGRFQNNLVVENHAYDPTAGGGMGGGLYCLVTTNSTGPLVVAHNTLVGNVASNLFGEFGGGIAVSLAPPADQIWIFNNILASNSSGIFQTLTTPMSYPALTNNLSFNVRSNYVNLPPGASDQSADPGFVDSAGGDFHLALGSPGIDAGIALESITHDLQTLYRPLDGDDDGLALPDLGAFEFVHPGADTDDDGLPDAWEVEHALNPGADDSLEDRDQDGASNAGEFGAGTDPQDRASVLRLSVEPVNAPGTVRLSWEGITGRRYDVSRVSSLGPTLLWSPLHLDLAGSGEVLEVEVPVSLEDPAFYRVEVRLE